MLGNTGTPALFAVRHDKGRYDVHLAHREIDFAQDQDRHFGKREDGEGRDELGQHQSVVGCEEVRGLDGEEYHQCERHQDADQLTQVQFDQPPQSDARARRLVASRGARTFELIPCVPQKSTSTDSRRAC